MDFKEILPGGSENVQSDRSPLSKKGAGMRSIA